MKAGQKMTAVQKAMRDVRRAALDITMGMGGGWQAFDGKLRVLAAVAIEQGRQKARKGRS